MTTERRHYQHQVTTLLETIRQGVEKLERLRARGLRGRALAEHEAELAAVRSELATLVSARELEHAPTPNPPIPPNTPTRTTTNRRRPAPAWTPALR